MIAIRTLGAVDLTGSEGAELRSVLAQPKRLALLAYLAVATPRGFHRKDTLLGLFWPESDPTHARKALNRAVYFLRRRLGEGVLESRGEELGLAPEAVRCDAAEFERALEEGRREEALDVYRGDLLEGFFISDAPEFERWLEGERKRLRVRAVEAALGLADDEEAAGNLPLAVRWARRAGVLEPYEERAARRLIELLDRSGDRAAALREYEEFERRLREDLELEPSPKTLAVLEEIRSLDQTRGRGSSPAGPLADRDVEEDAPDRRRKLASRRVAAGVVAIASAAAIAGALMWNGPEPVRSEAGAAPGVAVLPFRIVGEDQALWREGLVDLLSTSLDGAAGLRTIDPRSILSRWSREIGQDREAPNAEVALAVAEHLGASYAILGSMVASDRGIRIDVSVRNLDTGEMLGNARVLGSGDSIFALIDRLSLEILRTGLASEVSEMPPISLSGVTTPSLPALRHYLDGEREFRRSRFRNAIDHFRQAVERDSTFALAWHRLWLASGWLRTFDFEIARMARETADQLPVRTARLLRALGDHRRFRMHSLEELAADYPDDVQIWYELGDEYFHAGPHFLLSRSRFRTPLLRVLELDPGFGPAYIHLIDDAFYRRDSTAARELIARHHAVDSTSPTAIGHRLLLHRLWGTAAERRAAMAALDTASADVLAHVASTLEWSGGRFPEIVEEIGRLLMQDRHPATARDFGRRLLGYSHLIRGQVQSTLAIMPQDEGNNETARAYLVTHLLWHPHGYDDAPWVDLARSILNRAPRPWDRFLIGLAASRDGDDQMAAVQITALDSMIGSDRALASAQSASASVLARTLRTYVEGRPGGPADTAEQLRQIVMSPAAQSIAEPVENFWRYEIGRLTLAAGDSEEALRIFRGLQQSGYWSVPLDYYMGRIHEELGEVSQATDHFIRFMWLWKDCDPQLRSWREDAARALTRLERDQADEGSS